jgi:hypothetical protein
MPIPTHPLPPIDPPLLISIVRSSRDLLKVVRLGKKPPLTVETPWVATA